MLTVAGPAAALTRLAPNRPQTVALKQAAPERFDPQARAGDYLAGFVDGGPAGSVTVDLADADGGPVRRLVTAGRGRSEFRFVAEKAGQVLQVTAASPGSVTIGLSQHLAREQQRFTPQPPLSPAIARLSAEIAAGGTADAFWQEAERTGAPLVEPGPDGKTILTFLYRGARRNVRIFGAPSGDHDEMQRLPGSDVWYRSYLVPAETRLSYKLAPDVPDLPGSARERRIAILATAQADPLNRHSWPGDAPDRFNRESTVVLPAAPAQPWLDRAQAPAGTATDGSIASSRLGNSRQITIYRPPGFDAGRPDNLLLFVFDGPEYQSKVPTPRMLDAMIAAGALPPTVAVFVANADREARGRELPGNPAFADFMAEELLPRVLAETGLKHDAARTILAGSSFGGLAAATVAFRHPARFGNAISLSGSFWWHPPGSDPASPNHVAALFARSPRLPVRFFLSAGLFEGGSPSHGDGILETSRHLRDVLVARDYEVTYRDYAGGHDYLVWRGALADGLLALFGRR
ncbi:enterochelin esterase [Bosea minatitlanensis]